MPARPPNNLHDPALAKQYLEKSGYKGEPVVLLTDQDYTPMYNSALVMQQQMKAVGINAQLKVTDWPTSVQISQKEDKGWNFFFTGWGTQPALGPLSVMQFFAQSIPAYRPPAGHPDPEVLKLWNAMNTQPTAEERQQAFAAMQKYVLDQVYAIPFGSLTKIQAVRADVKGFVAFRIPRMSDVVREVR
jgi:peptide/nickel transport system substrate-binding protein